MKPLRVLDTGVLEGRYNIALGQALIEEHQAGRAPDTLRFLRFPPTALVGRHQALGQEINLPWCRENGIGVVRRITGGGAIFLDPGQLGWELVLHRSTPGVRSLPELTEAICTAAAEGLRRLGIDAAFRPRNDIEVGGRKISGTGGFFDGDTLFFQGTVLVDMDAQTMVSALRVPAAKLARRAMQDAGQRVVTLKELLGDEAPPLATIQSALVEAFCERFGLQAIHEQPTEEEQSLARALFDEEIGTEEFVNEIDEPQRPRGTLSGSVTSPGGTIQCHLRLEGPAQDRIREVLFTGDFFVTPPRTIYDLEARLRRIPLEDAGRVTREFFETAGTEVLSVAAVDFEASITAALDSR